MELTEVFATDAIYYVRLFLDESATIPYGDAKAIHIRNQSSGRAEYTDLPAGTYYLRETDANGIPFPVNEAFSDGKGESVSCNIQVEDEDTTEVVFDVEKGQLDVGAAVANVYPTFPDGFYVENPTPTPEISITITLTPETTSVVTPTPAPDTPTGVKTGDDTPLLSWLILLAVAAGTIIAVEKVRKTKGE